VHATPCSAYLSDASLLSGQYGAAIHAFLAGLESPDQQTVARRAQDGGGVRRWAGAASIATFVQSKVNWGGGLLPYADWPLVGLALGFGAMAGDSIKSLLKRLKGIPPGRPWIPMDQLDFVAGSLLLVTPFASLTWPDIGIILLVSFVGDIAVNHLAYALGMRDTKW
jgi:CDP-2,3-bis-(O-geranylgeranyl)-sn-glycerol synthase